MPSAGCVRCGPGIGISHPRPADVILIRSTNWLGKSVLLGDRFKVPDRGQQGCVALIVRALQRAGVKFEQRPSDMMPSDLAKRFGVLR
jgi:hypothetical protein